METKEYKKFTQQLADLQKSYSGSFLVVSHPPERGAHDDYSDSWALAVWGAKDAGQVDTTETQDRNKVLGIHKKESQLFRSRNRMTARRRYEVKVATIRKPRMPNKTKPVISFR